ncbi:AhpC/TSA family protein [Rossellomorea aquimaris]|uniref:AhpC/TSA family protein n=1 Tax=Rossellomorea aquimaris TaxID=189382 RepID=UPI00296FD00E|nr:AhpC/TSA family protein [Rossellomorea aquimaris]
MRERVEEFERREIQLIVIAPSKGSFVSQFLEQFGPFPFTIYGDPTRTGYKKAGTVTMPKWKLLSMALLGFVTGKVKNFFPDDSKQKQFVQKSMKTQDVYIQGATLLFNEKGKVVWKHIDESPEDHASIDTLLEKIDSDL